MKYERKPFILESRRIKMFKDTGRKWNSVQIKRGYHSLNEPDLDSYVAEMLIRRRNYVENKSYLYILHTKGTVSNYVDIDHIINRIAVLDPRYWGTLSVKEAKEWTEFVNANEELGRLSDGTFWIASGLQCKANLQLIPRRVNRNKARYLELGLFLGCTRL